MSSKLDAQQEGALLSTAMSCITLIEDRTMLNTLLQLLQNKLAKPGADIETVSLAPHDGNHNS